MNKYVYITIGCSAVCMLVSIHDKSLFEFLGWFNAFCWGVYYAIERRNREIQT